ncbi:unnamed protein product [Ixodes pacificus]
MALKFCRAVRDGLLEPSDITEDLIDEYNKIEDAPDVDFLLRTSGERRLSDFLLLQSNYSLIQVQRKYFPECTPRDVWRALLSYSQNSSAPLRELVPGLSAVSETLKMPQWANTDDVLAVPVASRRSRTLSSLPKALGIRCSGSRRRQARVR